ncbi:hypothetical protein CR513_04483, partial [Mucuna pruriens]
MGLLKSLVVYVLFMMSLHVMINFLQEQSNVCFLDILVFKKGTNSSSLETHNQDILQPSSSVHSQAELSPPSMSTCQSRTQEMGTPVCEDSLDSCPLSSTDPTPDPLPSSPSHDSNIGWPIALRKGIRSTRNPHPIYLSYHRLSPLYFSFVSSVSSITIPKSICEALDHPGW